LKGEKRAGTLTRDLNFSNGDHSSTSAPRTTGAFQWFLLNASLRTQFPQMRWITTLNWRTGWKIDIVSRLCFSMFAH
jgi:hypothetical protein